MASEDWRKKSLNNLTPLETLIFQREQNLKIIKDIKEGIEPSKYDLWGLTKEEVKEELPEDIFNSAKQLRKERNDFLLKCQTETFNSHHWVTELNEVYGSVLFKYDPNKNFIKNVSDPIKPFGPSEPGFGMPRHYEDEIATKARKMFESQTLVSILERLDPLYVRAINYLVKTTQADPSYLQKT